MKIVCFGCGNLGKDVIRRVRQYDNIEIAYFLDNGKGGKRFEGYLRYLPSKELCEEHKIVITNARYEEEIKKQLQDYGLEEYKHFEDYQDFFANCKMRKRENYPLLKVWYTDFWPNFDMQDNFIVQALIKYFDLEFDEAHPQIIFGSVFGHDVVKYQNCVKVQFTGENTRPNFEMYDYCIGFDRIQDERYLRYPLYLIYESAYEKALHKHEIVDMKNFMRRGFCSRVVSNGKSETRETFFERLNRVKSVASGGREKNNLSNRIPVANKDDFLQQYKFNLAFENSCYDGYITEKIIEAWAAGTIPIYWGSKDIGEEFNPKAFINYNDYASEQELINYILSIENDEEVLEKYLKSPIYIKQQQGTEELEDFLNRIVNDRISWEKK